MARDIYGNGKQFASVNELRAAILRSWENIPRDLMETLVSSMLGRIFEVINKNGGSTHYYVGSFVYINVVEEIFLNFFTGGLIILIN